jgi:hypothetical protein
MHCRLSFLFSFIFLTFFCSAQNWKSVSISDTAYYSGGKSFTEFGTDSSNLKCIWIDSARTTGNDSIYYFYKTIRDTSNFSLTGCLDTLADSWLGGKFIRVSNGDEYYFNSQKDSIFIQTNAGVGSSWILGKGSGNKVFIATIASANIINIDGVIDSYKTITIQAFQNNVPIYSRYNNITLQLSKNHGWTKVFDLYSFPDKPVIQKFYGTTLDSFQYYRVEKLRNVDISSKFIAGSEWIMETIGTTWPQSGSQKLTHDSIISVSVTSPQIVTAYIKHTEVIYSRNSPTDPLNVNISSSYGYTNFTFEPQFFFKNILPEFKYTVGNSSTPNLKRYYLDTFCELYLLKERTLTPSGVIGIYNGCLRDMPGVSGYAFRNIDSLEIFGSLLFWLENGQGGLQPPTFRYKASTIYLKLGNCSKGTKLNILAVKDATVSSNSYWIVPNPANKWFSISMASAQKAELKIFDINGRMVSQVSELKKDQKIDISSIPKGVYFVKLTIKGRSKTEKLVIY